MKKLLALLATLAVAAALAVPALAATHTVKIGDNWFISRSGSHSLTVRHGTTIKFVWTGKRAHNVYQLSGPAGTHFHYPRNGTKKSGTFKRVFRKRGNYVIVCTIHPGMQMKLHVR